MEVEEVVKVFTEVWGEVFANASLDRAARSAKLEDLVKGLLNRKGLKEDTRLCNEEWKEASCKSYVLPFP